jgi:hypothetical protein
MISLTLSSRRAPLPPLSIIRKLVGVITAYDALVRDALGAHSAYELLRHQSDAELKRLGIGRRDLPQIIHRDFFVR